MIAFSYRLIYRDFVSLRTETRSSWPIFDRERPLIKSHKNDHVKTTTAGSLYLPKKIINPHMKNLMQEVIMFSPTI